jgi:hypothetical protein
MAIERERDNRNKPKEYPQHWSLTLQTLHFLKPSSPQRQVQTECAQAVEITLKRIEVLVLLVLGDWDNNHQQ